MKSIDALKKMLNTLRVELGDVPIIVIMTMQIYAAFKKEYVETGDKGSSLFSYGPFPLIVISSLEEWVDIILEQIGTEVHVVLMHDEMLDEGWV